MADIFSFHGGRPLNLWERSCLRSFVDFGHAIKVFSYDNNPGLPVGVGFADAAEIVPRADYDAFLRQAPGAYPQFSDWFRYELLYERGGWWMDTDVLCLSPTLPNTDFFLARKKGHRINNAVMAFTPGHELMAAARDFARASLHKIASKKRVYIGPDLLSRLVQERNLLSATADSSVCYPFDQERVFDLADPAKIKSVKATVANSPFLHLFQEIFRGVSFPREILPPQGSFLAEKFVQHGAPAGEYLDREACQRYFELELERRVRVKKRRLSWRRTWRNVLGAVTSIGKEAPGRRAGKR